MIKKFLIPFTAILILCASVSAAPKNSTPNTPPRLLIAEITNYSVNDLKPEVVDNFYSILADVLKEDFNVESRRLIANIGGEPISNVEIFPTIHMNAIIHGPFYRYETSNVTLKNYADSILGKQRGKSTAKKNDGKAYRLSTSLISDAKQIGAIYGVDYLLFCNIRDIDAWRKIGGAYGANPTTKNLDDKKIQVDIDYYLVEVKTGKVFAGQISDKKTKLTKKILTQRYGAKYTVNNMLNYLLTEQALKIEKNIFDKGFKALAA
ncbi:MAG: hypothetical protein IJS29_00460 [Selenomonadaceae bacterium]|nr:hypothetical protein [Selenomonadaceae bacterium]